ncbi:MAG: hypothetical protein IRZ08_22535, partial [Frankia sp.]|nr:hypothetical protein [Frankia sp.]
AGSAPVDPAAGPGQAGQPGDDAQAATVPTGDGAAPLMADAAVPLGTAEDAGAGAIGP